MMGSNPDKVDLREIMNNLHSWNMNRIALVWDRRGSSSYGPRLWPQFILPCVNIPQPKYFHTMIEMKKNKAAIYSGASNLSPTERGMVLVLTRKARPPA